MEEKIPMNINGQPKWAEIYERYHQPLETFARYHLEGDPVWTPNDIAQETFTKAIAAGLPPDLQNLNSWLHRISNNFIIDRHRGRRDIISLDEAQEREKETDYGLTTDSPDDNVTPTNDNYIIQRLRIALKNLTPDQQEVIALRHQDDLGFKEIAQMTGRKYGAAKRMHHRAICSLRRALLEDTELEVIETQCR